MRPGMETKRLRRSACPREKNELRLKNVNTAAPTKVRRKTYAIGELK